MGKDKEPSRYRLMLATYGGLTFTKPTVILLQETGLGVSEVAARTCYNSFDKSENGCVADFNAYLAEYADREVTYENEVLGEINSIEHSKLLNDLAWTHFHYSISEHSVLSFLVKGTSRAVLQEAMRHRIASPSVKSTRYTMAPIINAFVAELSENTGNTEPSDWFINTLTDMDLFVTSDLKYNLIEINMIFTKLKYQYNKLGKEEFGKLTVAKSSLPFLEEAKSSPEVFKLLQSGKAKRNVGDNFKGIVTDFWKTDFVLTINLRSLKNFYTLRDSGASWVQIQWLAQAMKEATPKKYLDLIVKVK